MTTAWARSSDTCSIDIIASKATVDMALAIGFAAKKATRPIRAVIMKRIADFIKPLLNPRNAVIVIVAICKKIINVERVFIIKFTSFL